MRLLIFSDIHGNLPAFEKLLRVESSVDGYINLGDVVNYAPWSNECVELVASLKNCYNIKGNHEDYFIKGMCDVENPLVLDFFYKCSENFTQTQLIKSYSNSLTVNNFKLIHTFGAKDYIFHDTDIELSENVMLGHSHQQFFRQINGFTILNPGSVGQNRKYINVSEYVIWDLETNVFELKHLKFDLSIILNEMISQHFPATCINYYQNKKQAN
ncbi:MAG: metallophosphoesterase family protein [Bacteroidota bacterium]